MDLGGYEPIELVGRGGMGVVYRARARDGREVAVKVLGRLAPEALARFEREGRLLELTRDLPGFVPLIDRGTGTAGPFVVMPFLGAGSLRDRLKAGPLPLGAVLELGRSLSLALERIHARGVVHRDLKPENVLFDDAGAPLVADLGLARHFLLDVPGASQSRSITHEGSLLGTVGYMPPEQMADPAGAGPRADVFALGAILYECIAGVPPFAGPSVLAVCADVQSGRYRPLRELRPETPRWLAETVARALEPRLEDRVSGASELLRALDAPRARSGSAAWRILLLALVAAAVVAALGVALVFRRRPRPPAPPPRPQATAPARAKGPAWFEALPNAARPPAPLPDGISPADEPGQYVNAADGSRLVYVPPGRSRMGCDEVSTNMSQRPNDDERQVHEVELSGFFLGLHNVTTAQFEEFARRTGYVTSAERTGGGKVWFQHAGEVVPGATFRRPHGDKPLPPRHPVLQTSWHDARAYLEWAHVRLPTEAEWEKAATWDERAQATRRFPWGDDPMPAVQLLRGTASSRVERAGTPTEASDAWRELASPYGALDMVGNISQLCADAFDISHDFDAYTLLSPRDPFNPRTNVDQETTQESSRGFAWLHEPRLCRAALRLSRYGRSSSDDLQGFRIARSAAPRALVLEVLEPLAGAAVPPGTKVRVRGSVRGLLDELVVEGTRPWVGKLGEFDTEVAIPEGQHELHLLASGLEGERAAKVVDLVVR